MSFNKQFAALCGYEVFSSIRITDAVWVVLLAARGFSLWEIGFAEAVYHIVSLAAEMPSGMAADLLGRKRTLITSAAAGVASALVMCAASSLWMVCVSMALSALCGAFCSGTESALIYDSLVQTERTGDYVRVSANLSVVSCVASAAGSLSSLLDRALGFVGFYLSSAAMYGMAVVSALCMTEPIVTEAQASRERYPLSALPARFVQQVHDSVACLRAAPRAVRILLADGLVSLPAYLTQMYLQQRLVEQGWPTSWLFLPSLVIWTSATASTLLARRLHPKRLRAFYALCAALCGGGCLLTGAAPALFAIAGAALVQIVLAVWELHAMQQFNDTIDSDQRATLISVRGMLYSVGMIPASPLVGWLGDVTGHTGAGLVVLGLAVALSSLCMLRKAE